MPSAPEVVVVGGGIMGTSTAYHLARDTDLDVLLLEKESLGHGSTGKSSAIIRFNYGGVRAYSEMAYRSYEFWREADETLGREVGFTQNGIIYFGRDDEDYGATDGLTVLQELGIDSERRDVDACTDLVPDGVFVDDYDYGVYTPEAGFADPNAANAAFAENAAERGVDIETGVEVTGVLTDDGGRVAGVETTRGEIAAETVVLAAGPWSRRLAATLGVDLPISTVRDQSLLLSPKQSFRENADLFPTITSKTPGHVYLRPDDGETVLVGGHQHGGESDPERYSEQPDLDYIGWIEGKIDHRAPSLHDASLLGGRAGLYSNTPDKDFVIDTPVPNLVCLAGFSGHGFKHAPVVGEIATDLVTGGETDVVDLERFSLARFEDTTVEVRESL